jgi:hypothetical protein
MKILWEVEKCKQITNPMISHNYQQNPNILAEDLLVPGFDSFRQRIRLIDNDD